MLILTPSGGAVLPPVQHNERWGEMYRVLCCVVIVVDYFFLSLLWLFSEEWCFSQQLFVFVMKSIAILMIGLIFEEGLMFYKVE